MFFEPERWQYAIAKGMDKDMDKATMYRLTTPQAHKEGPIRWTLSYGTV